MMFADTLSSLTDKQTLGTNAVAGESFLDVYEQHRFLGVFPIRRYHARLYLRIVNNEWRVMLSDPKTPNGPFVGADYSTTAGDDAESALRGVWIRETNGWQRCTSSEIDAIGRRIARAVELAQLQYTDKSA